MFDFQAKLGPLPVWAWGLLGGGAVAGYFWLNKLRDNNGVEVTDSADAKGGYDQAFTLPGGSDLLDWGYRPSGVTGGSVTPETPQSLDTNTAWAARAIAALVAKGVSPIAAQAALNRYLSGEEITPEQGRLVDQAIKEIGAPPDATQIPNITTPVVEDKPTTTAPTAATIVRWIRLSNGQIQKIMSDGKAVNATDRDYINAGMPGLQSDAMSYHVFKLTKDTSPANLLKIFPSMTSDRLLIINGWKSFPALKKGMSVKVQGSRKGNL